MKKLIALAFTLFNIYAFQANAVHISVKEAVTKAQDAFENSFLKDLIDRCCKKSITYIFYEQNKDIDHSEDLSFEEKLEVLNVFFASVEISDEDKDYLTKEMLDGDFSLKNNLKIINDIAKKKIQSISEDSKELFYYAPSLLPYQTTWTSDNF